MLNNKKILTAAFDASRSSVELFNCERAAVISQGILKSSAHTILFCVYQELMMGVFAAALTKNLTRVDIVQNRSFIV